VSRSLLRGTAIVGSLTLLSRILGFIRDLLVAKLFGAGLYADAYLVAFRVPNLLRSIFAEGALTTAFVPTFAGAVQEEGDAPQRALNAITGVLLLFTGMLTIAGVIFSPTIIDFLAPGFDATPGKRDLCILLLRIMMPYIMFVSIIALLNGVLNTYRVFGTSARAQMWMNVVLILGGLLAFPFQSPERATIILACSVLVGGFVQVITQLPALFRIPLRLRPTLSFSSPAVRKTGKLMVPAIFGATIYQITIFVSTLFASLLGTGAVSWLFYADRLVQLPIGVFSVALSSVLLPTLSNAAKSDNRDAFSSNLINSLRYTSFCIVPLSMGLFVFAHPIVKLLFERGEFDAVSSLQTAFAIQAMSFGIWSVSCHSLLVRAFAAQEDSSTPAYIGCFSLLVTVLLSLIFMGPPTTTGTVEKVILDIQSRLPFKLALGHVGLALSSTVGSLFTFAVLSLLFTRRNPDLDWGGFSRGSIVSWVAGALSALIATKLILFLPVNSWLSVFFAGGVFGVSYFFLHFVLRSKEFQETFRLIRRSSR
jgi:putative peptidoglycan lipid II flippase